MPFLPKLYLTQIRSCRIALRLIGKASDRCVDVSFLVIEVCGWLAIPSGPRILCGGYPRELLHPRNDIFSQKIAEAAGPLRNNCRPIPKFTGIVIEIDSVSIQQQAKL
jgi:hypothetical protein